ncbi:hypothetical protein MMC30_001926 [Trapelia coarctata]|nr:hypothetical protein [Trapelia coarctata]
MVSFVVLCGPKDGRSQYSYLSALASKKCARSGPLVIMTGVVNVISDLYLIMLPIPAVWSLNLPFRKKVGVLAIFLTGFIACISSILGLVYRADFSNSADRTWAVIPTSITTIVEMTAGILVCCMPATAAAFKQLAPTMSSFFKNSMRRRRLLSGSNMTRSHERARSNSDRRPAHEMDSYQVKDEQYSNERKVWAGSDGGSEEWPMEYGHSPAVPHNDSSIRMTTKIAVARNPRDL